MEFYSDNEKVNKTISSLEARGFINRKGFTIDETLLHDYIETYRRINSMSSRRFKYLYARKMAGLILMKYKNHHGITNTSREGFVYMITNPAWNEWCKIGITTNMEKRLNSYQTSSPHRDFKICKYEFSTDRRVAERLILSSDEIDIRKSEWVDFKKGSRVFDSLLRDHIPRNSMKVDFCDLI